MNSIELLSTYLKRRFKGRIETFNIARYPKNFASALQNHNYPSITVQYGKTRLQIWVYEDNVIYMNCRRGSAALKRFDPLRLEDPDFDTKFYVTLIDGCKMKPSKLKADL